MFAYLLFLLFLFLLGLFFFAFFLAVFVRSFYQEIQMGTQISNNNYDENYSKVVPEVDTRQPIVYEAKRKVKQYNHSVFVNEFQVIHQGLRSIFVSERLLDVKIH